MFTILLWHTQREFLRHDTDLLHDWSMDNALTAAPEGMENCGYSTFLSQHLLAN